MCAMIEKLRIFEISYGYVSSFLDLREDGVENVGAAESRDENRAVESTDDLADLLS